MAVLELRTYTVKPGRMAEWLEIFDKDIIPLNDAFGIKILASWRNVDKQDEFIWLRTFEDAAAQKSKSEAMYSSQQWKAMEEQVEDCLDQEKWEVKNLSPTAFSPLQ
ncbi:MAG: NIPSNAP family protein [Dehalococcoidia bacterium]